MCKFNVKGKSEFPQSLSLEYVLSTLGNPHSYFSQFLPTCNSNTASYCLWKLSMKEINLIKKTKGSMPTVDVQWTKARTMWLNLVMFFCSLSETRKGENAFLWYCIYLNSFLYYIILEGTSHLQGTWWWGTKRSSLISLIVGLAQVSTDKPLVKLL